MSKIRNFLNRKMWVGLVAVFTVSLAVNAICSALLIKGIVPETAVDTCVYAAWGIGGLVGAMVAVKGEQGILLRSGALSMISFGLTWLMGFMIFGSVNFGGYGWGVLASICAGCFAGSFFNKNKKRKLHHTTGKGRNNYRKK